MKFLTLLFLLAGLNGFSQEPATPVKNSKFRIGVNASLEQISRRQGWHYAIESSGKEAWNIKHTEAAGGFTTNIRLGYAIGRRTDVEIGIGYNLRQFRWDYSRMRFPRGPSFIQPIGYSEPGALSYRQLHYLDIPTRITHMVGERSLRWISSIGMSISFLLSKDPDPARYDTSQPALVLKDPAKLNISPTISTGLAFFLSERSDLRLEPTVMYGITPLTDISVQTYMWSAGLNFGWYRRF